MKNKSSITIISIIAILLSFSLFFLYRKNNQHREAKNFIEKIRDDNKAGFDSLQKALNYENDVNYRIKMSIQNNDFNTAYALMDSLPPFGKEETIHLYKGMVYEAQDNYPEAMKEYNIALQKDVNPLFLEHRANLSIKMGKPDHALNDYKKAYDRNYDYSLPLAQTFELMKQKDSALKYYKIYLGHYPDDTIIKKKIISFQ